MTDSQSPTRPPVFPAAVNEQVIAPKREMAEIKIQAGKRLKSHRKKFEKLVSKFFKKRGEKSRYLQFYDNGYRFEAVFSEITSDGISMLGEALDAETAEELFAFVSSQLSLPTGAQSISIRHEKDENHRVIIFQLVADPEHARIEQLSAVVHRAPRQNPGM